MFDIETVEQYYPQAGTLMWEPMLMWKLPKDKEYQLEEVCDNGQYFASLKKDGACYQYVKTEDFSYIFGRTISKQTGLLTEKGKNVPHIMEALDCLPPRTVLVVEIYYPGKTSKDTVSIMGCLPNLAIKRQKDNPIHAYVHDILYYNGVDLRQEGALLRYKVLEAIWREHNLSAFDYLELAQPIYENIYQAALDALANGEEGLVMRKKTGTWEPGKRPAWNTIKVKKADSIDLVCIGVCPPTKEYTGIELHTWPYWETDTKELVIAQPIQMNVSEDEESLEAWQETREENEYIKKGWKPVTKYYYYGWPSSIEVGAYNEEQKMIKVGTVSSGLTDALKQDMAKYPEKYLYKVVELSCMEKLKNTIRHPIFIRVREDKKATDCTFKDTFR